MKTILILSIFLLSCLSVGCATQSSVQVGAYSGLEQDMDEPVQIQQAQARADRADRVARKAIHDEVFRRGFIPLPYVAGNGTMPSATNN